MGNYWDGTWGDIYVPTTTTAGGSNSSGSSSGSGSSWNSPGMWANYLNLFLEGANTYAGYTASKDANRKNVQLQREQQEWERNMSDTAVQRRAADIEKAGGNRALAFTNGQSASTPSVAPATVTPNYRPEWGKGMGAATLMLQAQLENTRANTELTRATATGKTIANNVSNAFAYPKAETEQDLRTLKKQKGEQDYDTGAIKQENERQKGSNLKLQAEALEASISNLTTRTALTSAERARFERMTDSIVALAVQQKEAGEIDLDALRNIANIGGVEAGKMKTIVQLLIEFFGNRKAISRGY